MSNQIERINGVRFENLTPHEVVIMDSENNIVAKIPPSGKIARVATREKVVGNINGVPIVTTEYGAVEGLPDPQPGTVYIVSLVVLQALAGKRHDVVAPNTAPRGVGAVRDSQGRIIGTRSFIVL